MEIVAHQGHWWYVCSIPKASGLDWSWSHTNCRPLHIFQVLMCISSGWSQRRCRTWCWKMFWTLDAYVVVLFGAWIVIHFEKDSASDCLSKFWCCISTLLSCISAIESKFQRNILCIVLTAAHRHVHNIYSLPLDPKCTPLILIYPTFSVHEPIIYSLTFYMWTVVHPFSSSHFYLPNPEQSCHE